MTDCSHDDIQVWRKVTDDLSPDYTIQGECAACHALVEYDSLTDLATVLSPHRAHLLTEWYYAND